jgi:hypothetical protein
MFLNFPESKEARKEIVELIVDDVHGKTEEDIC